MKFNHRSLFFTGAISAALILAACGDSTDSGTTSDDDDLVVVKSSSSSKKKSNSSSSADVKKAEDPSDLKESKTLEAPTGVAVERIAPSVWDMSFKYGGSDAESFVVQRIAPGAKSWEEFDELDAEVTHFTIDGADNGGFYYRIAAKNKESRSAYTEEAFVSEEVDYADGISLDAPTAKPNVSEDNILELVLTGNYPGKKITKSSYNKDSDGKTVGGVFYEARFVTGTEKQVDTVKVSADQLSIFNEYESVDDQCNAYAQIRVVWTDKNGVSDYGEWSDPMGTKAGTNSNLVDADKICEGKTADDGSSDDGEVQFSVPSNLAVKPQDAGVWMLEWSYKPVEKRPEDGFKIQKLDLENSKWEDFGKTGAGVYRAKIEDLKDPYNYFRVAAYDEDGESEYSSDILIALTAEEAEGAVVNPPSNLSLARVAPSVWELSWTYDIASDNDERTFIIQSSKLKDFEWTDVEELKGNVRYYHVQGRDKIETYYRMAVIDKGDTSAFTEAIQLTPDVAYREYMNPEQLTASSKLTLYYTDMFETDGDTATKQDITYTSLFASYTIENFISKYIVESEYTDTVYYEAHWFTPVDYYNAYKLDCEGKKTAAHCDSCYWDETFPYGAPNIGKGFYYYDDYDRASGEETPLTVMQKCEQMYDYKAENHSKIYASDTDDDERQELMNIEAAVALCVENYLREYCSYMVQFRIVWKDVYGETDYGEWSDVYALSDVEGADAVCKTNE